MSAIEFIGWIAIAAYIVSTACLTFFHIFVAASRQEGIEEAWRKAQDRVRSIHMSPHAVLGLSSDASHEEIKAAYRRMAMKHHPDRGGSQDKFQEIKVAYEQLMKPSRCPECDGKGTIRVKRGAFIDTVQCPRCWPSKEGEK